MNRVTRAIVGGFAATVVMTLGMYFVAPMMGVHMDIAAMLGSMMGGSHAMGMVAHFVNGTVIFPLIYVYLLYRFLPGSPVARGRGLGRHPLADRPGRRDADDGRWALQRCHGRHDGVRGFAHHAPGLWIHPRCGNRRARHGRGRLAPWIRDF